VASTIPASSSPVTVSSQGNSIEDQRRATIQYGTETEIITLIQTLKNEKAEYLDAELTALIPTTKNRAILIGTWSFFGDRAKPGLEPRALQAIDAWDTENAEIVTAAIDYVGKIKSAQALKPLEKLIDTEDRRFMNASFRALGQAASAGDADGTASFLIDYYTNRNPGDENMKEIIVAVGETGSLTGVDFLAGIAENENGRGVLRSAAVEALAKLGTGSDAIIVAANASDPNVRAAAIASLGPFSGAAVDNIILESFRDSYYRTRIAAAKAAGDRKLAAAVPYLQYRAKQDDVPAVKDEAIKALGIIGNDESMTTLESLFFERRSPDRVRLLVAEMLIKNNADAYIEKLIIELDEAKRANLTGLYNGFLKVLGMAKTPKLEGLSRRFLSAGGIVEKSLALDMIGNNEFQSLSDEVRILTADKNVGLARKAQTTLDKLVKS
jgi:HEAT repeat protein